MPREFELMAHLYRTMEYLDGFRATHDFDPPEGVVPAGVRGILRNPVRNASNDFAQLLGITDRRVQVCNFGSAIEVGEDMKVEIGDFRRRNAGTAAHFEMRRRMRSVTMGFDGKTASGWVTMPGSGLPNRRRQYQFHQLGHLMDRRRMGYLRDYDLWSQGLFFGRMLRGNLHGQSYVVHRDKATRGPRSLVIEGYPFVEATPAGLARVNDVTAALV
jgi:hypothetical protein